MKDQNMPCGHNWSDYVSCDDSNGTYMCGKCNPIGMRVAQFKAELEWRRREMERAMDAMFDGEYQWQEDDTKAMGQTIEGICETNTRLVNVEDDNRLLAKQILGEVRKLYEALR